MSKLASIFSFGNKLAIGSAIGLEGVKIAAPVVKNAFGDPFQDEAQQVLRELAAQDALRMKMQRYQRDMAMNTARLAAADPALYNEVMAGRRLAAGSRVFGGQPRTDLMEQLVSRMTQGTV